MKVKISGIQSKIIFCVGSGGAGFELHLEPPSVTPMISGQMPSIRCGPITGTVDGSRDQPKQVEDGCEGRGAARS